MATNFGVEATMVSDIPSAKTPKEGVVKSPILLEGLANIFDQANDMLKVKKQSDQEKAVADFTQRQLLVADALAQGKIKSSAHAQSLMRKNLLDAIDGNPVLTSAFIDAQKSITGLPGGAKIVDEGTEEEQRTKALTNKLVGDGYIAPNATDEEINVGISEYMTAQEVMRKHTLRMQTIDERLKSNELNNSERAKLEEEKKASDIKTLQDLTTYGIKGVKGQFDKILNDQSLTEAEKIDAMNSVWAQFNADVSSTFVNVSSTQASAAMKPFELLYQQYQDRASGKLKDDEVKRNSERIIELAQNMALQDPEIAQDVMLSKLLGSDNFRQVLVSSNNPKRFEKFLKFISGTTPGKQVPPPSPFVDSNLDRQGMSDALNAISNGMQSSDPEVSNEATQRMEIVMSSIEDYEGLLRRNPKSGIEVVNWLASPSFLRARKANPDAFANIDGASTAIETYYSSEVWGMVQREFNTNNIYYQEVNPESGAFTPFVPKVLNKAKPTPDAVSVRSTESGMEFFAIDPSMRQAVDKASRLNKELKPIINNTIHAMAHLNGNSNYKQLWEQVSEQFMGGSAIQDEDSNDNLSLNSFNTPTSALDDALATGGYIGSGDYTQAETPEDVAASFIGFNEVEEKNVISSFIKNTIGTNINPETTAWCAAFVNAALGATGKSGTDKLNAQSFLNWGTPVDKPQRGDVVVFKRGNEAWQGHVGFYVGEGPDGTIKVLGGNQGNKVSIKTFSTDKLLGYRRG